MHPAFKHALVLFHDSDNKWIKQFTKPGFGHCSVMLKSSENWWLHVNPTFTGCEWYFINDDGINEFLTKAPNLTCLENKKFVHNQCTVKPALAGIRSCSTLVSYLIGNKKLRMWPWGLYSDLLELNWRPIYEIH
tara:strand:- start:1086 stop:1487 length:402 start_codon:yes stop_codon:yes gene_type:complete